jgi:hypothetical protein
MTYDGAKCAAMGGATGNTDGKLHIENLAVLQE